MSDDNIVPENTPVDAERVRDELYCKDSDLRAAIDVIATAYRVHHVAQMAIERIVKDEGLSSEVLRALSQAGATKAKSSYYSLDQLLMAMYEQVVPFLKSEYEAQVEARRAQEMETRVADNVAATKRAVTIRLTTSTQELERGRAMLVVGDKTVLVKQLATLMQAITVRNDSEELHQGRPDNVINLSAMENPPQIKQYVGRIIRIPIAKWRHIATNRPKLKALLLAIMTHLPDHTCDLIVVDDGNQLFHSIHGREPCYDLEDGLRALRRVATEMNAALVCLAPIPPDCEDYTTLLKSRLKEHTEYIEV